MYIPIFHMWLSKLIQNGQLDKNDMLNISIDERTIEYFKTNGGILATLLSQLQCPHIFKIFPAPATILEGMKIRYHPHEYTQDVYMYLDIDVIVMKSLKNLAISTTPGNIYVCAEGKITDPNYGADMPSPPPQPHYMELGGVGLGYTSGIFLVNGRQHLEALFRRVHEYYRDAGYYSLDQPFFNRAVYDMPHDVRTLYKCVSFNGQDYSKVSCVLLNCGGDVADGPIHHKKIFDIICLINSGFF